MRADLVDAHERAIAHGIRDEYGGKSAFPTRQAQPLDEMQASRKTIMDKARMAARVDLRLERVESPAGTERSGHGKRGR
jgi:hypothetical protein